MVVVYAAVDVAEAILQQLAPRGGSEYVSAWKLQKLLYYCQVWSLVWDEERLFPERILAWPDGPVCREVYERHRGKYAIRSTEIEAAPQPIDDPDAVDTIEIVLDEYGGMSGKQLRDLTHDEDPWVEARQGLGPRILGSNEITPESMIDYYGSL